MILTAKKTDLGFVGKNYPEVLDTINKHFSHLALEDQQKIAGFVIDATLKVDENDITILNYEEEFLIADADFN